MFTQQKGILIGVLVASLAPSIWAQAPATVTKGQLKSSTKPAAEAINITFDDIRDQALPKIREEKTRLKQTAEKINELATDEARDTIDYAMVHFRYKQNLNALASHSCYREEKTVSVPELTPPTANAQALLMAEFQRLEKEAEEKREKEEALALQLEQQKKQDTIIAQQRVQIEGQKAQLQAAEEQVQRTAQLQQQVQVQNQLLGQQLQTLNNHARDRNSLLYERNQELGKLNRYARYGF